MDEDRFIEASKSGNLIPLHKTIFSDHLTPVLAYRCLVKEDDREAPSFLFESVEPGFRGSSVVRGFQNLTLILRFLITYLLVIDSIIIMMLNAIAGFNFLGSLQRGGGSTIYGNCG